MKVIRIFNAKPVKIPQVKNLPIVLFQNSQLLLGILSRTKEVTQYLVFLSVWHIRFLFTQQNYILKEEEIKNNYVLIMFQILLIDETRKSLWNEHAGLVLRQSLTTVFPVNMKIKSMDFILHTAGESFLLVCHFTHVPFHLLLYHFAPLICFFELGTLLCLT